MCIDIDIIERMVLMVVLDWANVVNDLSPGPSAITALPSPEISISIKIMILIL